MKGKQTTGCVAVEIWRELKGEDMATIKIRTSQSLKYVVLYLTDYGSKKDRVPLLTNQLYSDQDIDESIDFMIKQLEKSRKSAKLKLHKLQLHKLNKS